MYWTEEDIAGFHNEMILVFKQYITFSPCSGTGSVNKKAALKQMLEDEAFEF
mgnify:CR=1 FL=1